MLKNGAASVISSSDTVGEEGVHSRGAFIDNFYLLGGRLFKALWYLIKSFLFMLEKARKYQLGKYFSFFSYFSR